MMGEEAYASVELGRAEVVRPRRIVELERLLLREVRLVEEAPRTALHLCSEVRCARHGLGEILDDRADPGAVLIEEARDSRSRLLERREPFLEIRRNRLEARKETLDDFGARVEPRDRSRERLGVVAQEIPKSLGRLAERLGRLPELA